MLNAIMAILLAAGQGMPARMIERPPVLRGDALFKATMLAELSAA